MKASILFLLSAISGSALAGAPASPAFTAAPAPSGFADARRPITNPTLFDLALPTTNIHPMFLHQRLPAFVNTTLGPVQLGGDVEVYALQFEYALNDRLSIVATKDGYVDFNPDGALWGTDSGFANLGAGLKYAFLLDPASRTAISGTLTCELPTGNHSVFQGEGDGAANIIVSALKLHDAWQFAGAAGAHLPFDPQLSTTSFVSAHASYEVTPWFIPLVEFNWHHVLDAGSGQASFFDHAGGAVPSVATFEGSDLLNFGASNASMHRDFATAAIGFRSHLTNAIDLGLAYEVPLTRSSNSVMKDRITLDLVWTF